MTKFNNTLDVAGSGIVAGGHPPVIHNVKIPNNSTFKAGQVLLKSGSSVTLWTGSLPVPAMTAESTATQATTTATQDDTTKQITVTNGAITVETELTGDGASVTRLVIATADAYPGDTGLRCLVHGCYVTPRVGVGAAKTELTVEQIDTLAAQGLFSESHW